MSALVETQHVTQVFGNPKKEHTVALDDFSFSISETVPSFTAIVGESGSGKTTLARILLGFQYPDERHGTLSRHGHPQVLRAGAADLPPGDSGDLPGPLRGL